MCAIDHDARTMDRFIRCIPDQNGIDFGVRSSAVFDRRFFFCGAPIVRTRNVRLVGKGKNNAIVFIVRKRHYQVLHQACGLIGNLSGKNSRVPVVAEPLEVFKTWTGGAASSPSVLQRTGYAVLRITCKEVFSSAPTQYLTVCDFVNIFILFFIE